jgi:hypothetical protein
VSADADHLGSTATLGGGLKKGWWQGVPAEADHISRTATVVDAPSGLGKGGWWVSADEDHPSRAAAVVPCAKAPWEWCQRMLTTGGRTATCGFGG